MTVSVLSGSSTSGGKAIPSRRTCSAAPRLPRLLVSVRNAREARLAIAAGVDLVDVKEPQAGPLGMASLEEIAKIAAACRNHVPLSVAVGEIEDAPRSVRVPPDVWLVKAGPAGCASADEYFRKCADRLPACPLHAAVAYADWQRAAAPRPQHIAAAAVERGYGWLLLDTFGKDGQSLLDHVDETFLRGLAEQLHAGSVHLAVAGSLRAGDVERVTACHVDVIAFRTAACRRGRMSGLSLDKLRLLRSLVGRRRAAAGRPLESRPRQQSAARKPAAP